MTTTEDYRYRGYEIVPRQQWSHWCASVYPTRADLPILSRSTLRTLRPSKEDALDAANKICHEQTSAELTAQKPLA
jgi:hypothetical protein